MLYIYIDLYIYIGFVVCYIPDVCGILNTPTFHRSLVPKTAPKHAGASRAAFSLFRRFFRMRRCSALRCRRSSAIFSNSRSWELGEPSINQLYKMGPPVDSVQLPYFSGFMVDITIVFIGVISWFINPQTSLGGPIL